MGGHKVDEGAVQAEFLAICSLMQSVCGKIGPQTWQGGSANRFAAVLNGHNGSLAAMMEEIWHAVRKANKDNPPIPPQLPRANLQPARSGIASLNPDLADSLAGALDTAGSELPQHGKRLSRLLAAGGSEASTRACSTAGAWCKEQVRVMHQRAAYARASDKVGNHAGQSFAGQSQIPDVDKFGSAQMRQLAKLEAALFNQQFDKPDKGSPQEIARIGSDVRENMNDADFLHAFFGAGGVEQGYVGRLPFWMNRHNKDGSGRPCVPSNSVIKDFGTALAALSRKKDGESQSAVWNALGRAGSDMPGQGLLVKYSSGRWGSHVLAELGKAALRWRLKFPYYSITKSPGNRLETTHDLINPDKLWTSDWGIYSEEEAKEFDPALSILHKINVQKDEVAARELAGAALPSDMQVTNPEKSPATWLSRLNGDTYASLLAAPDWLDKGTESGGVLGLATAQHPGMNRDDANDAARIAAKVMQSVAWWNKVGRKVVSGYIGKDAKLPPEFAKSKQYNIELGDGLKDGLQKVALVSMPALGNANRTRSDISTPDFDTATGFAYVPVGGDTAREFLRAFANDKRRWAQIAAFSSLYRQALFSQAIRTGDYHELSRRAGYLDGTLIAAKVEELENRTKISKAELDQQKTELAYLRDAVGVFIPKIPLPRAAAVQGGDGAEGKTLGDVPGFTDMYSLGTDWLIDKAFDSSKLDERLKKVREEGLHYTDSLDIDLARAIGATYAGPLGYHAGVSLDAAIRKMNLSERERDALMDWAENFVFTKGDPSKGIEPVSGASMIHAADDGTDYNGPSRNADN